MALNENDGGLRILKGLPEGENNVQAPGLWNSLWIPVCHQPIWLNGLSLVKLKTSFFD